MDLKAFLSMVFFTIVASRAPKEEEFYVHSQSDDYVDDEYDEPRTEHTDRSTSVASATNKPAARYEVTEKVDDIPNNVTYTGPIVANFTIKLPHNNATVIKNKTNTTNNNNNKIDIDRFVEIFNGFGDTDHHSNKVNKRLKNNSVNFFNVHNKYDDHKSTVQNIYVNKVPNFGSLDYLKEKVDRFKDGVVDFIYNVKKSAIYNDVNHGFIEPFFNKVQTEGSAVATKVYDAVVGYFNNY